jgi:hypothetical protein
MSERNAVQQAYDRFGQENGFEKKSGSWYRQGEEAIGTVNLQKSQYGPQYYLNVGFWLRELGDERHPKLTDWHISARIEDLVPEVEERIGQLLDLEHPMPDDERSTELVALLNDRLLPLLERGSTVAGLRSMRADETFIAAVIRVPAQELLA